MKWISGIILLAVATVLTACNPSDEKIKQWVEANPEVILKSLMDFQMKQEEANRPQPAMVRENGDALFRNAGSPVAGEGSIEIAYFFDFNCGHCARQSETIKAVMAQNKNVKVIYKNLPVLGPPSELAARAALAAHQQGRFKDFYEETYKVREKTPESMKAIAQKLKLDLQKWESDINSEAVSQEINHVRELAGKMKIGGTPALAIAPDKIFPGRVDQLAEIIQSL